MTISFKTSKSDADLIETITARAVQMAAKHHVTGHDPLSVSMDITACHANGCPLRLADLAEADNANFSHDVFGIRRHIDRNTGQLGDCFLPRFAVMEAAA